MVITRAWAIAFGMTLAFVLGGVLAFSARTDTSAATDPVIVAAGDICKGTSTNCAPTANLIGSIAPDDVLTLGDNAYESGTLAQFNALFAPNWGRYKAKLRPTPGNHEWLTANAAGYHAYMGATAPTNYYSWDVGAWHMIALNSKAGGANGLGSPEEVWLKQDLAAHPNACTLAYWHEPKYSSGVHGSFSGFDQVWKDLYAAGVDVVLNGHDHIYERFNLQNATGGLDTAKGIRQFTVGTGGANHTSISTIRPNSQVRNATTFGVLKMTLHPGSYDWKFMPVAGSTFTDSGTTACSGAPATPPPTTTVTTTPPPPPPTTTTTTTPPPPVLPNVTLPARAAFFYPWFPEAWNQQGFNPFTVWHPTAGYYDSSNLATIERQVADLDYAAVKVAISSWWGQATATDRRFPQLMDETDDSASPLKWATYYEKESQGDPSVDTIRADLTYLKTQYAGDAAYARVGGKFVVFVFSSGSDGCAMAQRWKDANTVGAYVVLKVFSGYKTCAAQPQGWHQYAPAVAADSQAGYSYSISPGFWKKGEASARLARDPARFRSNVAAMNAAVAPWKLVTTFNEWGEGSPVESASEWASPSGRGVYLDALHAAP